MGDVKLIDSPGSYCNTMMSRTEKNQNELSEGNVLFFILYFILFTTLPLVYSEKIIDPVLLPRQILLSIFLFITLITLTAKVYDKKETFDLAFIKTPIPVVLIMSIVLGLLSTFSSFVISESIYGISKEAIALLFCLITVVLLNQKRISLDQLSICIVSFTSVVVFISYYQLWSNNGNFSFVKSTMANKNLLSSVLFLCIPFLFNVYFLSKKWKVFIVLLSILLAGVFWITQTKGVIVALILLMVTIILLRFSIASNKAIASPSLKTTSAFVMLVVGIILFTVYNQHLFPNLFSVNTTFTRLNIWKNSVHMIMDNPLLGVGAENWKVHFSKYGLHNFNESVQNGYTIYQRPHNDLLKAICEKGFFAAVLFLSMFVLPVKYCISKLKNKTEKKQTWFIMATIGTFVGFLFIAIVDYPFERIEHLLIFYVLLSIVISGQKQHVKNQKLINYVAVVIFLLITGYSFKFSFKRYQAENYMVKVQKYRHSQNWVKLLKTASKIDPAYYQVDPTSIPVSWYTGVAKFSLEQTNEAKQDFKLAHQLNPNNIHVLNNLASCYEKEGQHEKAKKLYKKAATISPKFQEVILNLSAVYFNQQKYESAFQTIDKCPITCTDKKYAIFLLPILRTKLKSLAKHEDNEITLKKINRLLQSDSIIVDTYYSSRLKNVTFLENIKLSL